MKTYLSLDFPKQKIDYPKISQSRPLSQAKTQKLDSFPTVNLVIHSINHMAFLIWDDVCQVLISYQFNATPVLLQKKRQHITTSINQIDNCEKILLV